MKSFITTLFAAMLGFYGQSQTIIIDYTEKTLESEYELHFLEAGSQLEMETFSDIKEAKLRLLKLLETYLSEGFEVKTSTISSHPHRSWFKKGMHYHYQYVLQNSYKAMEPEFNPAVEGEVPSQDQRQNLKFRPNDPNNPNNPTRPNFNRGGGNKQGPGGGMHNGQGKKMQKNLRQDQRRVTPAPGSDGKNPSRSVTPDTEKVKDKTISPEGQPK